MTVAELIKILETMEEDSEVIVFFRSSNTQGAVVEVQVDEVFDQYVIIFAE